MAVNMGGYIPTFRARLNHFLVAPAILVNSGFSYSTGRIIDTDMTTTGVTPAMTGTQYGIEVVAERFLSSGIAPSLTLSVNNTGVCSINTGMTTYISTGDFRVIGTYSDSSIPNTEIHLRNLSGAKGVITSTTVYIGAPVTASGNILVVYNVNSNQSINLKDYYTGRRPQFQGVNTLGLSCVSGVERVNQNYFNTGMREPIKNYLTGVSGVRPIRYMIFMLDVPTRILENDNFTVGNSIPYQISDIYRATGLRAGTVYQFQDEHFSLGKFQGNTCLVTCINFSGYDDNIEYINRICAGQTGLYLTGNGLNTGYYFEDYNNQISPNWISGRYLRPLLNEFTGISYVYRPNGSSFINTGNNVAGFATWGANGFRNSYFTFDSGIIWGGINNWYIMTTVESYNGIDHRQVSNAGSNQSSYTFWFRKTAFGGTGWENCPIGAVGHVEEPFLAGVSNSGLFILWERGWPLIEAAWQSHATNKNICFGDPLITRR